jgi:hypothetical protein
MDFYFTSTVQKYLTSLISIFSHVMTVDAMKQMNISAKELMNELLISTGKHNIKKVSRYKMA